MRQLVDKMKLVIGILLACSVAGTFAQDGALLEGLMSAQSDLALAHEFFETIFAINRGQLSAYVYRINRLILNSHMDTFEFILTNGLEARELIEGLTAENDGQQQCLDRVIRRFDLQKQRFGQALARCVGTLHGLLTQWNAFANGAHMSGQVIAVQSQNIGINLFARTRIFDGPEDFPAMINRELWTAITLVMDFVDSVTEFISNISINIDEIGLEFLMCDRDLETRVVREIELEVGRAQACVGQGPTDPNPTA